MTCLFSQCLGLLQPANGRNVMFSLNTNDTVSVKWQPVATYAATAHAQYHMNQSLLTAFEAGWSVVTSSTVWHTLSQLTTQLQFFPQLQLQQDSLDVTL